MLLILLVSGTCAWWYRVPLARFKNERLAMIERARAQKQALASNPAPGTVLHTWPYAHHMDWPPAGFVSMPEWEVIRPTKAPFARFKWMPGAGDARVINIARSSRDHVLQISTEPEYGYFDPVPRPGPVALVGPKSIAVRIIGDAALGDTIVLAPEAVPDRPDTIRLRFRQKDFESEVTLTATPERFKLSCPDGFVVHVANTYEEVVVLPSPLRRLHDASAFVRFEDAPPEIRQERTKLIRSLVRNDQHLLAFDGATIYRRPREGGEWTARSTIDAPEARFTSNGKWLTWLFFTYDAETGAKRRAPVEWHFGSPRSYHNGDREWVWRDETGGTVDRGREPLFVPAYARDFRPLISYGVGRRDYFDWFLARSLGDGPDTEVASFKRWRGVRSFSVSPDERWLAIASGEWLDVVNLGTGEVKEARVPTTTISMDLYWSPDSRWLLIDGDERDGPLRTGLLISPESPIDFWHFPLPAIDRTPIFTFSEDGSCLLVSHGKFIAKLDLHALAELARPRG